MEEHKDWYVRRVRHVLLDVVAFSRKDRTADDQVMIIRTLNNIVREALCAMRVREEEHILLPTGDGMCICLLVNNDDPDGRHLAFALQVHQAVQRHAHAAGRREARSFEVRIGLNEHHDCVVKDINGNVNIAGYGINLCQRIMNVCEGGNVLLGRKAYDSLPQALKDAAHFRPCTFVEKHGEVVEVFQLVDAAVKGLNRKLPSELRPNKGGVIVAPPVRSRDLRSVLTAVDPKGVNKIVDVPITEDSMLRYTCSDAVDGQGFVLGIHFRTSLNEKGWMGISVGPRPERIWSGSERTIAATGEQGPDHDLPIQALIRERWPELVGEPIELTRLRLTRNEPGSTPLRVSVHIHAPHATEPKNGVARKKPHTLAT